MRDAIRLSIQFKTALITICFRLVAQIHIARTPTWTCFFVPFFRCLRNKGCVGGNYRIYWMIWCIRYAGPGSVLSEQLYDIRNYFEFLPSIFRCIFAYWIFFSGVRGLSRVIRIVPVKQVWKYDATVFVQQIDFKANSYNGGATVASKKKTVPRNVCVWFQYLSNMFMIGGGDCCQRT